MLRPPRARPRARPVGPWHQRPNGAPTPQRASAVSHAGSLTGSSRTGWPDAEGQAGGKAEASTNGREAATSVWQADVSAGTRRARRTGQCCSPCRRCLRRSPIGGVSSSERVPRVRRRGEAAPLGRAWLEWGSCLETRASGAPCLHTETFGRWRSCRRTFTSKHDSRRVHGFCACRQRGGASTCRPSRGR